MKLSVLVLSVVFLCGFLFAVPTSEQPEQEANANDGQIENTASNSTVVEFFEYDEKLVALMNRRIVCLKDKSGYYLAYEDGNIITKCQYGCINNNKRAACWFYQASKRGNKPYLRSHT